MPRFFASRVLWGGLLILAGLAILLQNIGLVPIISALFWGPLMAVGGIFFLLWYLNDRGNWWAIIPAFTLLSIAFQILLGSLFPQIAEQVGGLIVLGGIGAAFLFIYLTNRTFWWAIIPAGVMLTLAVISVLGQLLPENAVPGILFLGLGLTFALLAFVPVPQGRMRWAWIPASILLLMGLIFMVSAMSIFNYLWPAALILLGIFLVFQTIRPKEGNHVERIDQ